MGRAMLFIVSGMIIIFGMVQISVQEKQESMAVLNVDYVSETQARNFANSGMERALNRLVNEPNWRTDPQQPWAVNFAGNTVLISVEDSSTPGTDLTGDQIRVTATSTFGEQTSSAVAMLTRDGNSPLPEVPGSMGIYTENLDFRVSGSAFLINGNDVNPDGTPGPEGSLPGIAVSSADAYNEIMGSTNATQKSRIQGSDATDPSLIMNTDADGSVLDEFVARMEAIAIANGTYYPAGYTASGVGSLGTPGAPEVTVIESGSTLSVSNATGAGVIIIKEGATLDARGNFDNFQGLIVVQGRADMTRGNIHILGAMLFGGSNPTIEIDIDFRGNVNVQYSSQALLQAEGVAGGAGGGGGGGANYTIVNIYD